MANDGTGRPREVTCEEVLAGFDEVERPVATAPLLSDVLGESKQTVLRRLRELEKREDVERWKVGGRAVVWWPVDDE
jgi:predicted ArsR family transcriptional regulator